MSFTDQVPRERADDRATSLDRATDTADAADAADAAVREELDRLRREGQALADELTRLRAELVVARQLALHDTLTGLANRMLFLERLEHGIRQARRHGWTLAVLFIDLDDFKRINDTHGHEAGDEVLAVVARCLQSAVRAEDTVCRYGGDEFACLLLNVLAVQDVRRFATNLERRLNQACTLGDPVTTVNASIGVSLYPEHGRTAESLLRHADTAMYQAKGTPNRVMVYQPEGAD